MSESHAVLFVVEVHRDNGQWTPAWDGEGAAMTEAGAEAIAGDIGLDGLETRVARYVREEPK